MHLRNYGTGKLWNTQVFIFELQTLMCPFFLADLFSEASCMHSVSPHGDEFVIRATGHQKATLPEAPF